MGCRVVLPTSGRPDARDNDNLEKLQYDLLEWAEELFGERDTSWTLLAPDFDECECTPHIFFPDHKESKLVQIKLGCGARKKWNIVLFQMAHEVIHLLNPRKGCKANNLEEGVACAFSAFVQRRCIIIGADFVRDNLCAYKYARRLVRRLPQGDIAAAKLIRKEMPAGSSFSSVSKVNMQRIFPEIDTHLADELSTTFDRDRTEFPQIF